MPRRSVTAGDDDDEAIVARTIPQRERELVDSRFSLPSLECVFGFRGRDAARARCVTRSRERRRFSVFSYYSARRRFGLWQKKFNNFT